MTTHEERTRVSLRPLLDNAAAHAAGFLEGLPERRVAPTATAEELREELGGPLPEHPLEPARVVADLAEAAEPGLMATAGGRFFGFVIGGSLPAALAADWLTSAWDQNAGLYVAAPAASVAEEVSGEWLVELFGLPREVSYGFVTGCQMANFTPLAAARHSVLEAAGWDVEAAALAEASGPTIVCAQAGNVNTGAFDPLREICEAAHEAGAWVHVDGAFGMWAAATPSLRHLVEGIERADSWATDAHKWLNVPYDSGLVFCAHQDAHRAAMGSHASYLVHSEGRERDELDWTPHPPRPPRPPPAP